MKAKPLASEYLRLLTSLLSEKTATILMIDNNHEILPIIARFFRFDGYNVIEAPDAATAIKVCQSDQAVDILISDYDMPEITGTDLALVLRMLRPSLRMVFMTGDFDTEQSLLANDCMCVRKPLLLTELEVTISSALRKRRAREKTVM
jgi:DNA-binding NtrC family response regulator